MKKINVAVIGVGAVGVEMLRVLKQRKFPAETLRVFARLARRIDIDEDKYDVESISSAEFQGINVALFAGTEGEKGAASLYARKFIDAGAVVIDNGADFRLKEGVPLVVPEVNSDSIRRHKGLIANPNCTTIQAVTALGGIYKNFGLKKIVLTSFQAVSGAGKSACIGLWQETKDIAEKNKNKDFDSLDKRISANPEAFAYQIAFNVIPQIGEFGEDNYTNEEWKVVRETHKIFSDDSIKITATCARIPVFTSHCEAIYFTTRKPASLSQIAQVLGTSAGVRYLADGLSMPIDVEGSDEVFAARLRRDPYEKNSFWIWCVADNLRKGAALNAVQIAEHLL